MELTAFASLSDQQLVELSIRQTTGAYDALVSRYQNTLIVMLENRGVANPKDIVQDSFIRAYLNLEKYNPDYSFGSWITTITRNMHVDHTRRAKSSSSLSLETVATPIASENPEQTIINSQNNAIIEHQLAALSPQYQNILRLRFWDELSYEEIADKLQMPLGTVKTQIHRARTQLMNALSLNNA